MSQSALNEDEGYYTDLPVGEILKRTREHYGRSLEDIEKVLRIRAEQLDALEKNEMEKLPAKVYAVGFVRSYSEYLGLDGDKMVRLFKTQSKDKPEETYLQMAAPASDNRLPSKWLLLASAMTILVMSRIYMASTSKTRDEVESVPPVPESIQQATLEKPEEKQPAMEEQADEVAQAEAATPPAEEKTLSKKPEKGIILNIRENSWVEIKSKAGTKLLSQVLKAGDQYFVPNRPNLLMSIGNAGGVEIEVDGQPLRLLGGAGVVRRNIPLDGGYLKSQYADQPEKALEN